MGWILYLIAVAAGLANPFQSGTNAELNKQLGAPLWAGVWVYGTGLLGLLLVLVFFREAWPVGGRLAGVSWWAWTGGLISIASTMAGLMLAQKMGSGTFTGISVTAGLVSSVVLDQMGLLGLRQHPASPMRLLGCGLMIGGVWLVSRG